MSTRCPRLLFVLCRLCSSVNESCHLHEEAQRRANWADKLSVLLKDVDTSAKGDQRKVQVNWVSGALSVPRRIGVPAAPRSVQLLWVVIKQNVVIPRTMAQREPGL